MSWNARNRAGKKLSSQKGLLLLGKARVWVPAPILGEEMLTTSYNSSHPLFVTHNGGGENLSLFSISEKILQASTPNQTLSSLRKNSVALSLRNEQPITQFAARYTLSWHFNKSFNPHEPRKDILLFYRQGNRDANISHSSLVAKLGCEPKKCHGDL